MSTIGTVIGHVLWTLFSCLVKGTMVVGATLVAYGALDVVNESTAVNVSLAGIVALLVGKYLFIAKPVSDVVDEFGGDNMGEGPPASYIDRANDHYVQDERTGREYAYRGDNVWHNPDS